MLHEMFEEKKPGSDITSRLDRLITINGFLYLIFVCVYLCFNSFLFEFVFKVCTIIDWWLMMRCFVLCGYLFLVLLVTQSWKGNIRNLSFDWATIIESLSNQRYQTVTASDVVIGILVIKVGENYEKTIYRGGHI